MEKKTASRDVKLELVLSLELVLTQESSAGSF
jgi:hypothetical protein